MVKPALKLSDTQLIKKYTKELRNRDSDPAFAGAPVIDAYARISKNPNTGEMEKTDRQLADILRMMLAKGYRLGVILRDDNVSAFKRNTRRPAWLELLRRVTARECQGVMCWNLDRLVRQPWDLEILIKLSEEDGFIADSCSATYNLSDDQNRTYLRILVAFFNAESAANSRRQKHKQQVRREAGLKQNGNRAMGHPGAGISTETLNRERDALRRGVRDRLAGASVGTIVDAWNAAGVLTPAGNKWSTSSVIATMKLARHAGLSDYGGEILGPAENVEAIITPDDFYALRALSTGRKSPTGRKDKYVLSGAVLCGGCSHPMKISGVEDRRTYRCPSPYSQPKACGKTYIAQEPAEEQVKKMVLDRLSDPVHADSVARKSSELTVTDSALALWNGILAGITQERTSRMGSTDPMTTAEYSELRAPAVAEVARLTAIRETLIATGANDDRRIVDRDKLQRVWNTATDDEKRRLICNAFPYGIEILPREPGAKRGPGTTRANERIRERQPEAVSDAA